jgi:hypothetical protein
MTEPGPTGPIPESSDFTMTFRIGTLVQGIVVVGVDTMGTSMSTSRGLKGRRFKRLWCLWVRQPRTVPRLDSVAPHERIAWSAADTVAASNRASVGASEFEILRES